MIGPLFSIFLLMWLTNLDVSELDKKQHDTCKHFSNVFAFGFVGSILFFNRCAHKTYCVKANF